MKLRVGLGWDRHRLEPDEQLCVAGVLIDSHRGTVGHSDADPALHAIIDSLLGAAGMGDIGEFFPPDDPSWKNASSKRMLSIALEEVEDANWQVINTDVNVILSKIKLSPYRDQMISSLEEVLPGKAELNLKFKTGEEIGPLGRAEAIEAQAVSLLTTL